LSYVSTIASGPDTTSLYVPATVPAELVTVTPDDHAPALSASMRSVGSGLPALSVRVSVPLVAAGPTTRDTHASVPPSSKNMRRSS
jgi:hypothetical protein